MFDWISKLYNVLKNLPAIVALIQQLLELIKPLVGEAGKDETAEVAALKRKAADLGDKAGVKRAREMLFDR